MSNNPTLVLGEKFFGTKAGYFLAYNQLDDTNKYAAIECQVVRIGQSTYVNKEGLLRQTKLNQSRLSYWVPTIKQWTQIVPMTVDAEHWFAAAGVNLQPKNKLAPDGTFTASTATLSGTTNHQITIALNRSEIAESANYVLKLYYMLLLFKHCI